MRTLARFEVRWALAAFGAIFPSGADAKIPLGIEALDLEGYLNDLRSRVPFRVALGLRLALWMVALAPLFVLRRAATVASLEPAARAELVSRLAQSPIYAVRQLVLLLKTVGAILFANAPEVRAVMLAPADVAAPKESGPRLIELRRKGDAGPLPSEGASQEAEIDVEDDEEGADEQSVA